MSFHHRDYLVLLDVLRGSGRATCTVGSFLSGIAEPGDKPRSAILRHDVDRKPSKAVEMALLEFGVATQSTYYFRCNTRGRFPARAIESIVDLGHEVGFHYECLSRCRGDRNAASEMFREQLAAFRRIGPCRTVSMHGAPLSPHNNLDLLRGERLEEHGLLGDAVLSLEGRGLVYFTDTGGRWGADATRNLRDRLSACSESKASPSHPGFGQWLAATDKTVYLSTHPERWSGSRIGYGVAAAQDRLANALKHLIRRRR